MIVIVTKVTSVKMVALVVLATEAEATGLVVSSVNITINIAICASNKRDCSVGRVPPQLSKSLWFKALGQ